MVEQSKKIANTPLKLALVAVLMFGFGFLMVPLYDLFCDITGLNGKTKGPVVRVQQVINQERLVTVQFLSTNNDNMLWDFQPLQQQIKVHPGAWNKVSFWAFNPTKEAMVAQAVPSVSPSQGAEYLQKAECFCFEQQQLEAGEGREMELVFTVTGDLPAAIQTLTLSYTLFDASAFAPKALAAR
jgi:cytochrome c oxidase assembly protein subunit 11